MAKKLTYNYVKKYIETCAQSGCSLISDEYKGSKGELPTTLKGSGFAA